MVILITSINNNFAGGVFGPGVYHSNFAAKCLTYASKNKFNWRRYFGVNKNDDNKNDANKDDSLFFFVNQVLSMCYRLKYLNYFFNYLSYILKVISK